MAKVVPLPTPEATPEPSTDPGEVFYYTVQPGDTLEEIADRFGSTVVIIVELNGIDPDDPLIPGTVIIIPGSTSDVGNQGGLSP